MTAPDPRVGEIQARLAAATPGPWANYGDLTHEVYPSNAHEDEEPDNIASEVPRIEDAWFIANAPTDVAYLLGMLRQEQAETARLKAVAARYRAEKRDLLGMLRERDEALARATDLINDLSDADECYFDHHGGCQAHGYLSLEPGQTCPQHDAKEWARAAAAIGDKPS